MLQNSHAVPTGVPLLDERLHGGIRPGSLVVLTGAPTSQTERFLTQLTRPRPTLYLTTQRSKAAVEASLASLDEGVGAVDVHELDPSDPLDHATVLLQRLSGPTTLVVDSMNPLEAEDSPRLWAFLNDVQRVMTETGGFALLHCVDGRRVPPGRDTTEYMADVVFDLETETYGDAIQNRLFVPKVRNGESLSQAIKLDLTRDVTIDTSRDIS